MRHDGQSGETALLIAGMLNTFLFGFVALGVDLECMSGEHMLRAERRAQADPSEGSDG